ncbi:MAG TPA: sigma-70 family RNA polymerase sigma factor [Candidatus Sulfopaludibacter sp.]|jgi:RNA polymerase sigma factor (TIGR02999 family)|nr:sigma-70 family RNA polymerase sigma factor [Candidatus Sulfopaludibacter sp.]
MESPGDITQLLNRAGVTLSADGQQTVQLLYAELRRIASKLMAGEPANHTLQPTAVANEAYLKLVDERRQNWDSRTHFFAAAAQVMRHILVDYGRKKHALKRGGEFQRVDLDQAAGVGIAPDDNLLALDEALQHLERRDPRQSRIVELRYFGGLTEDEVAGVLSISVRTVKREWGVARAWLYAELTGA